MVLAFYKVDNEFGYDRHTFDSMERQEIIDALAKLSDEDLMVYDLNNDFDLADLKENYNDEILDGGWWCVMIAD